jgi:hypothetical protein
MNRITIERWNGKGLTTIRIDGDSYAGIASTLLLLLYADRRAEAPGQVYFPNRVIYGDECPGEWAVIYVSGKKRRIENVLAGWLRSLDVPYQIAPNDTGKELVRALRLESTADT